MEWIPIQTFRKILKLKKRLKAIYGGSSAGKTVSILPYLYQKAVDNPGEVISVVSNTMANLKKGAMRDFKNILVGLNVWDPVCWKISEAAYHLNNGSIIEFVGADDETKLRGPRRTRCYINEANRLNWEVYKQIDRRTEKEMILDWNPSGPFWYNEHLMDVVDHDVLVVNFNDNEALNEQQMQVFHEMERMSTRSEAMMWEWKVYGLGEWGQISGACISDYKICDVDDQGNFWYNGEPLQGYQSGDIGLDFGNNDPNAAVKIYNKENESFIFDELLYKNKMDLSAIYDSIKFESGTIYADYAWPQTIKYLQDRGLQVKKCKKGPDSIKNGIDLINHKDIYVTSRSKNLLMEFQTYRYKEDKDGNKVDGKYEGPDHLVDACRYVLKENVKPKFFVV